MILSLLLLLFNSTLTASGCSGG